MPKPTQYKTKTTVPTPLVGATSAEIRSKLVEALKLDLVGPDNAHPFAHEILPQSPRRWYLAGFLVPKAAPKEAKRSKDDEDEGEGDQDEGNEARRGVRAEDAYDDDDDVPISELSD